MKIHELKTVKPYYDMVASGQKKFELRKNDRGFEVDDILVLMDYDDVTEYYSGYNKVVRITGILKDYPGLEKGYCILSISNPL